MAGFQLSINGRFWLSTEAVALTCLALCIDTDPLFWNHAILVNPPVHTIVGRSPSRTTCESPSRFRIFPYVRERIRFARGDTRRTLPATAVSCPQFRVSVRLALQLPRDASVVH